MPQRPALKWQVSGKKWPPALMTNVQSVRRLWCWLRKESLMPFSLRADRWGRSTFDLVQTLHDLDGWNVSLIAQTGLQFDLKTPQGKLFASLMAAMSEFERDLLKERICSGIAAAKARGKTFGRKAGYRPKSDRLTPKVISLVEDGRSYRFIARELNLSKNTVMGIVHRHRLPV